MNHVIIFRSGPHRSTQGFTLIELLASMALLTFLMLALAGVTESASRAWREGQSRTETFQSARTSLEIVGRELTPAVVDTRMQFVVAPGSILTDVGAKNVAPNSPVALWMAPLGDEGSLHCIGYYLYRDNSRKFYRLKRIYIAPPKDPDAQNPDDYFPRLFSSSLYGAMDPNLLVSPVTAAWFNRTWKASTFNEEDEDDSKVVVSTAADGVIAFWVQPLDLLGNPIPRLSQSSVHPKAAEVGVGYELAFNSAAYFQMATSQPFDDGASFLYLAHSTNKQDKAYHTMKANRVPAAIEITLVTIDSRTLRRHPKIPEQPAIPPNDKVLDVAKQLKAFGGLLDKAGLNNTRTFTTRVKLVNGS